MGANSSIPLADIGSDGYVDEHFFESVFSRKTPEEIIRMLEFLKSQTRLSDPAALAQLSHIMDSLLTVKLTPYAQQVVKEKKKQPIRGNRKPQGAVNKRDVVKTDKNVFESVRKNVENSVKTLDNVIDKIRALKENATLSGSEATVIGNGVGEIFQECRAIKASFEQMELLLKERFQQDTAAEQQQREFMKYTLDVMADTIRRVNVIIACEERRDTLQCFEEFLNQYDEAMKNQGKENAELENLVSQAETKGVDKGVIQRARQLLNDHLSSKTLFQSRMAKIGLLLLLAGAGSALIYIFWAGIQSAIVTAFSQVVHNASIAANITKAVMQNPLIACKLRKTAIGYTLRKTGVDKYVGKAASSVGSAVESKTGSAIAGKVASTAVSMGSYAAAAFAIDAATDATIRVTGADKLMKELVSRGEAMVNIDGKVMTMNDANLSASDVVVPSNMVDDEMGTLVDVDEKTAQTYVPEVEAHNVSTRQLLIGPAPELLRIGPAPPKKVPVPETPSSPILLGPKPDKVISQEAIPSSTFTGYNFISNMLPGVDLVSIAASVGVSSFSAYAVHLYNTWGIPQHAWMGASLNVK